MLLLPHLGFIAVLTLADARQLPVCNGDHVLALFHIHGLYSVVQCPALLCCSNLPCWLIAVMQCPAQPCCANLPILWFTSFCDAISTATLLCGPGRLDSHKGGGGC